jgi:hypothetical protein
MAEKRGEQDNDHGQGRPGAEGQVRPGWMENIPCLVPFLMKSKPVQHPGSRQGGERNQAGLLGGKGHTRKKTEKHGPDRIRCL